MQSNLIMKPILAVPVLATLMLIGAHASTWADESPPGATVESLLALVKARNPEYASMRFEAQAASERVAMAGALMDPKFRVEWMDITKMGSQSPTLWPGDVGSTKYTIMQDLPWFGKRDLKKNIAQKEAQAVEGKVLGTWAELAAKVKVTQAQRYYLHQTQRLTNELLDLTGRLANVAQVRYAGGLAMQQDVIRAQVEQTAMQTELIALSSEVHHADARMNALLARPTHAPLAMPEAFRAIPAAGQLEPESLTARVRQKNPQLFADDARIGSAEMSRELTLKNRYPDFTLAVTPTQVQSGINEWSLMLEVNIPLQQGSRRAQEREAQAMLDAAQARKQATAHQVASDLAENLSAIDAAQRTEQLVMRSLLPQTELTFQSAMAAYENGKLDFATLLDAQRQVRQAKQSQLKAQLDAQMRWAELEKLLGEE
jgi:outer membrane protein TolC